MAVGRRLFAERGFAGTSKEQIVVHERVTAVATAPSQPWPRLVAGCAAFLDACLDPATQRIALVDAPPSWDRRRSVSRFLARFGNLPNPLPVGPEQYVPYLLC